MQFAALALLWFSAAVMIVVVLRFIGPPPLRRWLLNHTRQFVLAGALIGMGVLFFMVFAVIMLRQ